jgi:hypothetical protein
MGRLIRKYNKKKKFKIKKEHIDFLSNLAYGAGVLAFKGGKKLKEKLAERKAKKQLEYEKRQEFNASKYAAEHAGEKPSYMR